LLYAHDEVSGFTSPYIQQGVFRPSPNALNSMPNKLAVFRGNFVF
jgi:hypothetical protein